MQYGTDIHKYPMKKALDNGAILTIWDAL